jgi:tetratricopeptide (TPR) repeat protein
MSRENQMGQDGFGARDAEESLAERLAEASSLAEQDQWDEAFELLLHQEAAHPEDATLLCMLGVAARRSGADGMAYDFFRRCLAQDPEDPVLLATSGAGIAAWDDPDAERVLRLAALSAPQLSETRLRYGAYLAREGLFDAAIVELEAARDLDTDDAEIRLELGIAYLLASRTDLGLTEFAEALSRTPDDTWIQALYGLALADAGSADDAAEQLVAASLERVDDWEVQVAAALAAAAEEWTDQAWDALSRADLVEGADRALLREVEERIESGAEAARDFLQQDVAAPILRTRLLLRD